MKVKITINNDKVVTTTSGCERFCCFVAVDLDVERFLQDGKDQ